MSIINILYATVANKCPRCHKGQVFVNNNPYNIKNGVKMNERCPHCGLKYEREVGYFYGAMYMSYTLQVGVFVIMFALNTLWWRLSNRLLISIILIPVFVLFPVTFRWSRILWISFFTPYDKSFAKESEQ